MKKITTPSVLLLSMFILGACPQMEVANHQVQMSMSQQP